MVTLRQCLWTLPIVCCHFISAAQSRIMALAMDDAITGARRPNLPSRTFRDASRKDPSRRHSARSHSRRPEFRGPDYERRGGPGEREKSDPRKIKRSHRGRGRFSSIRADFDPRRRPPAAESRPITDSHEAIASAEVPDPGLRARASDERGFARRDGRDIALVRRTFDARSL
jgi:hypothetical protein